MLRRNPGQAPRLGRWSALTLTAVAVAVCAAVAAAQGQAKTDAHGDPLPAGARARLGTLRWRHSANVSFVAFALDGKAVVTASQDGTLRLWDRATGKELRRFQGPPPGQNPPAMMPRPGLGPIRGAAAVALSSDGKVLAAAYPGQGIYLWDVATGKELHQIKTPEAGRAGLLFTPDGKMLVARTVTQVIHLLDTRTGKELRQPNPKKQQDAKVALFVTGGRGGPGMALSADGKTLATAETTYDNNMVESFVRLTDLATGKEHWRVEAARAQAGLAFSPNGKILACAAFNGIVLREAATGRELRQLTGNRGTLFLAFAPDGKTLAVKGRDQVIHLFEIDTGKELRKFSAGATAGNAGFVLIVPGITSATPQEFTFSPDGKALLVAAGQTLRLWDVGTGKEQPLAGGHGGTVSALAVSPDGKALVSGSSDQIIRRWDGVTGKELGQIAAPPETHNAAFAPDGRTAALAVGGTIRLVEVATGKERHQLKGHETGTTALAFSANGQVLASRGTADLRLHDVVKGTELRHITLPVDRAMGIGGGFGGMVVAGGSALALSPDGRTVAAYMSGTPQGIRIVNQPQSAPAVAADTLRLWDVASGKEIRKITLPQPGTVSIAYSPDGRVIAVENADQTISLWEVASGKERARLGQPIARQPGPMMGGGFGGFGGGRGVAPPMFNAPTVAFSPDGTLLAAKGAGHAVAVWDVLTGKEVGQFKGHDGALSAVAFSADGKTLATGSRDTTVLVWELAALKRAPRLAAALAPKEVAALWGDLVGEDAGKAYHGILRLAAAPKQAVPFLGERLKPAVPVDAKTLQGFLADLDSKNFKTRDRATKELLKLGGLAVPALQKLLAAKPALETQRRVEALLDRLVAGNLTAEQLRLMRAVEVLERAGTAEARQVLQALAQGAPGALPTQQAQAALARLSGR